MYIYITYIYQRSGQYHSYPCRSCGEGLSWLCRVLEIAAAWYGFGEFEFVDHDITGIPTVEGVSVQPDFSISGFEVSGAQSLSHLVGTDPLGLGLAGFQVLRSPGCV